NTNLSVTTTNALTNVVSFAPSIYNLAIDPSTPSTLYAAGTPTPTELTRPDLAGRLLNWLYKSTDAGTNWTIITNGLTVRSGLRLAITPSSPANLYVGTAGVDSFGEADAFLAKLGTNNSFRVFGGFFFDQGRSIAVDALGQAFIAGITDSPNFPTS